MIKSFSLELWITSRFELKLAYDQLNVHFWNRFHHSCFKTCRIEITIVSSTSNSFLLEFIEIVTDCRQDVFYAAKLCSIFFLLYINIYHWPKYARFMNRLGNCCRERTCFLWGNFMWKQLKSTKKIYLIKKKLATMEF